MNIDSYHMPSFSRIWSEPVPKLSSPHIDNFPASIRLPKNFQPVGTSKNGRLSFSATRSSAPLVGIERASPYKWGSLFYLFHFLLNKLKTVHKFKEFILQKPLKRSSTTKAIEKWSMWIPYLGTILEIWNCFLCISCNNCNRIWRSNKKTLTQYHVSITISCKRMEKEI